MERFSQSRRKKMKLNIKIHTAEPRVEKIKLSSEMVELMDLYVQFYQSQFKVSLTAGQAIIEMLSAFIRSDRNFMRWYRGRQNETES